MDPCMRDCGIVKSIWVEKEGCPWVPNVSSVSILPYRNYNLVFIKAKTKASVHSFCFIIKLSPLGPARSAMGSRWLLD